MISKNELELLLKNLFDNINIINLEVNNYEKSLFDLLLKTDAFVNDPFRDSLTQNGCSFSNRNIVPMQKIKEQIKNKLNLLLEKPMEEMILNIADIGCGKGISTYILIHQMTEELNFFFETNKTIDKSKFHINIDMYDYNDSNIQVCNYFKNLVNGSRKLAEFFSIDIVSSNSIYDKDFSTSIVEKYDLICLFNVLHYIYEKNYDMTFKNLFKCLKNNGIIVCSVDKHLNSSLISKDNLFSFKCVLFFHR